MIHNETIGHYIIYEINEHSESKFININGKDLLMQIYGELPHNEISVTFDKISGKDLRRLDHTLDLSKNEAIISLRKNIVIFSIDTTRAIILHNKLYFIVPNGADSLLKILDENIKQKNQGETFEYQCYDSLLKLTKHFDEINLMMISLKVKSVTSQINRSSLISLNVQDELRTLKTSISNLLKHFLLVKTLLNNIVDDDEKLTYLNLTLLSENPQLFEEEDNDIVAIHREKMSSLFEVYLYDYTSLFDKMNNLNIEIENVEDYAILKINTIQNQLMLVNLIISVLSCVIGFCAYITGLFGMNLDNVNYLQNINGIFNGVVISTSIFIPMVTYFIIWNLKSYNYIQF